MSDESKELVIQDKIVLPAVSGTQAIDAWNQYQELKGKILDPATDVQVIGKQEFKKKSYWRKVAAFFNLSAEVVQEEKELLPDAPGHWLYNFTVRVTAPNGRHVEGVASCDAYEKAELAPDGKYRSYGKLATPNNIHNVRSTAYTRAFNRAVSDMVGGGEVSAEEVSERDASHYVAPQSHTGEIVDQDDDPATDKQIYKIKAELKNKNYSATQIDDWFAKNSPLTKDHAREVIEKLVEAA